MLNIKEGDSSKAVCYTCRSVVNTTYQRRDVPLSDASGIVENTLVAVCDTCGEIGAIPAGSIKLKK